MDKKTKIKKYILEKIEAKSKLLGVSFDLAEGAEGFSLTGTGIFDSMDFMNLITDIEATFNVEFDFTNRDPDQFTTLGGFISSIADPDDLK